MALENAEYKKRQLEYNAQLNEQVSGVRNGCQIRSKQELRKNQREREKADKHNWNTITQESRGGAADPKRQYREELQQQLENAMGNICRM